MKVSIIIPAYNEEKRIGSTLEAYTGYFKELYKKKVLDYELLIVINNTKDKTLDVVKKAQKKDKKIRYLDLKQGGKGYAVVEGFKDALNRDNDLLGFVDADLATAPEYFYDLIKNIDSSDFAIASRGLPESKVRTTLIRKITNRGFNFVVRSILLLPFRDTQCGAKVFKREAIKATIKDLGNTEWAFDVDLLFKLSHKGFKGKEIATVWNDKAGSKINLLSVPFHMFASVVRLRLIYSPFSSIVKLYDKLPESLKL